MKRADFIKIVKLRSEWKIDKRKGNYMFPNGERLSIYIEKIVESQMKIDNLGIKSDGDLFFCQGGNWNATTKNFDNYILMPAYEENELCEYDKMESRIKKLIYEIIG